MKNIIEKIKNWLKTEKVVNRATLILLCLSIFACGVLYTLLLTNDSCNNESVSSCITLVSEQFETDLETENIEEETLPLSDDEFADIYYTYNYRNVSKSISLDLPNVSRPEISQSAVDNIYTYVYNYANYGIFVDSDYVEYPTAFLPYYSYGENENLLYIPASRFDMYMYTAVTSNTPSGLYLTIDSNGVFHINGTALSSSILRIKLKDLFKYSFFDINKTYTLYTNLLSDKSLLNNNMFVGTYYSGTSNYVHSNKFFTDGSTILSKSNKFDNFDIELQVLCYAGTYNDLQFTVGLCANDTYNAWKNPTTELISSYTFATKTKHCYDLYRFGLYGFNNCYNHLDTYFEEFETEMSDRLDKFEDDVYNSRDTLVEMLSSVVSAPINFLKDTLNFSLFGFNLFNVLASLLTLILTAFVIKKLL